MDPNPPTKNAPHNKSKNARLAEARGERTWTNFTLKLLIEEVIRLNEKDVTEASLRAVRSLNWLKVKLLTRTEQHHTAKRMPGELRNKKDWYYRVDPDVAKRLKASEVARWKDAVPSKDELAEAIEIRTGRKYAI